MAPPKKTMEEFMVEQAASLANITAQLTSLKTDLKASTDKITNLEQLLTTISLENKDLKEKLSKKDEEIKHLKNGLNDIEQHQRNYSIRVLNLPLSNEDATNNFSVMQIVYEMVLKPILAGAVERGIVQDIPSCYQLLETAHILPGPPNKPRQIIVRFNSRNLRNLVLRLKKDFAPRAQPTGARTRSNNPAAAAAPQQGAYLYPVFEDLTRASFAKMREIANHPAVLAAWSVNGAIRYRLKNEDIVRKVVSPFDSIEAIIPPAFQ